MWPETVAIIAAILSIGWLFQTGFEDLHKRIDDLNDRLS
jgi:hypothetical protein